MPSVPVDGRLQVPASVGMVANVQMGRWPTAGLEPTLDPNTYIISGSWPKPRPSGPSGFSGLAAKEAQPEVKRSSAAARAIWPSLP
jgi:hypothetical protein